MFLFSTQVQALLICCILLFLPKEGYSCNNGLAHNCTAFKAQLDISRLQEYSFPELPLKDGRILYLSGLERVYPRQDTPNHIRKALNFLTEALEDNYFLIHPSSSYLDSFGRIHGHVYLEDGRWLNGILVEKGMARAQYIIEQSSLFEELLTREKTAREAKRGLWDNPKFAILDTATELPTTLQKSTNSFVIAEGRINAVSHWRSYLYLNFGDDWRDDFTIGIPSRDKSFNINQLKSLYKAGSQVQIRGLLENWNGPFIRLYAPEHLRLLTP